MIDITLKYLGSTLISLINEWVLIFILTIKL